MLASCRCKSASSTKRKQNSNRGCPCKGRDAQVSANAVWPINPVEIGYVCSERCTKLSVLFAVSSEAKITCTLLLCRIVHKPMKPHDTLFIASMIRLALTELPREESLKCMNKFLIGCYRQPDWYLNSTTFFMKRDIHISEQLLGR